MTFKKDTIRFGAARQVFPQFDIEDRKKDEGNYRCLFFGEILVHKNLTDLCKKIVANLLEKIAKLKSDKDHAHKERGDAIILAAKFAIQSGHNAGWRIDQFGANWADFPVVVCIDAPHERLVWRLGPEFAEQVKSELPEFTGAAREPEEVQVVG